MALNLYHSINENDVIDTLHPFSITFDGRIGGAQDKLIYLRNDDDSVWYSNVVVSVVDKVGSSLVNNSVSGWYWKLIKKDFPPIEEDWRDITAGASLSLGVDFGNATLGDTLTYLPIWVRVVIPRNQPIQTIKDIVFKITAQEGLV